MKYLLILLLATGCTRALSFEAQFGSGSDPGADLTVVQAADLARSDLGAGADLPSADLPDLRAGADLAPPGGDLATGALLFTKKTIVGQGNVYGVAAANLDGDGPLEVAVLNNDSDIEIYRRENTGSFVPYGVVPTCQFAGSFAAVDLDEDGDVDLIAGCEGAVTVLSSIPQVANVPNFSYTSMNFPYGAFQIVVVDLDHDSHPDLVVKEHQADGEGNYGISVFFGNQSDSPEQRRYITDQLGSFDRIEVADVDGNDLPDLIALREGQPILYRNLGGRDEPFGPPLTNLVLVSSPRDLLVTRVGSQRALMFAMNDDPVRRAQSYLAGDVNVGVFTTTNVGQGLDVAPFPLSLTAGDFNGDGRIDIVVGCDDHRQASVTGAMDFLVGSAAGFLPPKGQPILLRPNLVAAADINGDGRDDLVIADEDVASNVQVWISAP